jgi:hypothetical protein
MRTPTEGDVFKELIDNLRKAQDNCATLGHLTRDNDAVRAHGWLAMSELLGRAVHNVIELASPKGKTQMEAPRDCAIGASNHPKLLPEGTYVCVVQGLPHQDRSWKTQTEFVRFTLKPIEASCDVDADALAAMGGLENRTLFAIFHLTDNSLWRLKKFLADDLCISEVDDDGKQKTFGQMASEAPGKQVLAYVKHRASEDGTVEVRVGTTAPVNW